MKKITKFEANDGMVFDTAEEAVNHDELLELEEWYESSKLSCTPWTSHIEWDDLIEWIYENKNEIKLLMKLI